jgi:signal transduction histidine kinase
MNRFDFFSIHTREILGDDKKIRADIRIQMVFRYGIIGFATIFLYLFRHVLPFPFPHFFLVACTSLAINTALHLLTMNQKWRLRIQELFPYADAVIAAPIFLFTGGFLSPFVITHIATNIGSVIVHTHNRNLAKHTFLILLVSFLSVALLQKFEIVDIYVGYATEMMRNGFFFTFVVAITSLIIIASYVLINALNFRVHQMLDEMCAAFSSIVRGTSPVAGSDFFIQLVRSCAESLHVDRVILGELAKGKTMNVLAQTGFDEVNECGQGINITGTLFAEILSHGELSVENSSDLPDQARWLVAGVGADCWSFFGTTLRDATGNPIGVFCLVNKEPISRRYLVEPIVSIFTSRAAAELERKLAGDRQKQAEQQLAQAHKMTALGQLASGITHDLNNMLTVINGYAGMLVTKVDAASPAQNFASQILTTTSRATEHIGTLARFLHKEKMEKIPLDINSIVSDTVAFLELTFLKNITVSKNLATPSSFVIGNRTLMQNVFINLAINARDAIEKTKGTITFTTGVVQLKRESTLCRTFQIEPGDYCTVEVADTGSGMSDETMRHLFEPFFTTKSKGMGTGLGLANVWGYIENNYGAIEVKSELNKGSTFLLYFPQIRTAKCCQ